MRVEVVIEIPRGSFLKRGSGREVAFVSPFPCPWNYGSIRSRRGDDGDPLDAVVVGPRLPRGTTLIVEARGAVRFTDGGIRDDKIICSRDPITPACRRRVLHFFRFYALCKRWRYRYRGASGATVCEGWLNAEFAMSRARPVSVR